MCVYITPFFSCTCSSSSCSSGGVMYTLSSAVVVISNYAGLLLAFFLYQIGITVTFLVEPFISRKFPFNWS